MQKGENKVTIATPGGSLALETELDPALTKADALSGGVVSTVGILPEITRNVKIKFKLFNEVFGTGKHENVTELKINEMLMLSLNTSITVGKITKVQGDSVEFSLKIPVVPLTGESIGLARNIAGHWRLIGFGEII